MVELVVRLVFSLTVVVGLLLGLARLSAKRFRGSSGALVQVVHRQQLSRGSSLSVVTIGSRVLVLGTTEQQVQLLTELDPEELDLSPVGERVLSRSEEILLSSGGGLGLDPADGLVLSPAADMGETATGEAGPVGADRFDEVTATPASALWPPRLTTSLGRHAETRKSAQRMRALGAARASDGALAGSLLSAQTWKQAFTAAIGGNDRDVS
jgi:flagellar protein FliO/FliZ